MSSISFHVQDNVSPALRRFRNSHAMVNFADSAGPRLLAGLREYSPYDSRPWREDSRGPHMRDRIRMVRLSSIGAVRLVFSADVPQAAFTIHGTKPHVIPKDGSRTLLSWMTEGGRVFVMGPVFHPGTTANPWPTHLWDYMRGSVEGEFRRAIEREWGR